MRVKIRALCAAVALGLVGVVLLGQVVPAYAPRLAYTEGESTVSPSRVAATSPVEASSVEASSGATPSAEVVHSTLLPAPHTTEATPIPAPMMVPTEPAAALVTVTPPLPTVTPLPQPPDVSPLIARLRADPALLTEVCRPDRTFTPGADEVVVPILLYHFVGREALEADGLSTTRYNVTTADFAAQLALLHYLGYQTVTVSEVIDALLGEATLPERPIALTVDDGWVEQYTHLFPLLQRYGMKATFYVPSTYPIGGRFVTWEYLAEMVAAGMEIGSHTRKHVNLTEVDDAVLWRELATSKATLEEQLEITVDSISYPFGAYNGKVAATAAQVGYRGAVALGTSPKQAVGARYALNRVEIFGDRPLIDFVSRLPWRGSHTPLCAVDNGLHD